MIILAIGIALVAIVGFVFAWLRLQRIMVTVDSLERIHKAATVAEAVNLTGLPSIAAPHDSSALQPLSKPQRFIILGHKDENIFFDNFTKADAVVTKKIRRDIPEGTTKVVASIRGFILLFGKITSKEDNRPVFRINDHHLGLEWVNIIVVELTHTDVTLEAQIILRDVNGDDDWSGFLGVSILFLGPHP
jgi:hypothetical protein